jgi:hypothetical protein
VETDVASFLEFIDDKLGINFHAPVYNPTKGRTKLVKVIDKAAEQHREGKTPPVRSWKTGGDNAISFAPQLSGTPVLIAGKEVNYVPAEHFQEFLKRLKAEVEKGGLDKEIEAALEGETTNKLGITTRRASGKPSKRGTGLGNVAKPDDAEWMAKFREVYGEPDPSIVDPVPNTKGDRWIAKSVRDRGQKAAVGRGKKKS